MARFLSSFFYLSLALVSIQSYAASIAVIIDDIGYKASDKQVLSLPNEVTIAVLPQTPYGTSIARVAGNMGREVMLHIPMESLAGRRLGPGGLVADMTTAQLRHQIELNIQAIPNVVGVNNHMGSRLTQMREPMTTLMSVLKQHDLYFVDSRTTRFSLAEQVAREQGVMHWRRHVFLDSEQNEDFVRRQFALLLRKAERNGFAVAIGHPYPATLKVLKQEFAKLDHKFTIARISSLPKLATNERYAYQKPAANSAE